MTGFEPIAPPFPFCRERGEAMSAQARSTVEALRRVEIIASSDLAHERPYADGDIVRLVLRKQPAEGGRAAILAFEGDDPTLAVARDDPFGVVRPVQRWVRRSGLERARSVDREVVQRLADPWGYVRVRVPELSEPVSITPPVLEQVGEDDARGEPAGLRELLVCDGNHRIVQSVWRDERPLAAVAVLAPLPIPYYARPYEWHAWDVTATRVFEDEPARDEKYRVRDVPGDDVGDALRDLIPDPSDWYRRYYRDLSTGFGSLGGQAGRPAGAG